MEKEIDSIEHQGEPFLRRESGKGSKSSMKGTKTIFRGQNRELKVMELIQDGCKKDVRGRLKEMI